MTALDAENVAFLPGMGPSEPNADKAGYVERETRKQIEALRTQGFIEDHHAGQVALAIVTAQSLDRASTRDAASGRANLTRAMKEVFEMLPQPAAVSASLLEKALAVILDPDDV
ncbi:hypothetical protein [Plantibacter sp. RU18]|uniref:hypothetical protein n=1 Tax=Plantibacter sp. RU18 TaxID=3158143 RepID=UPI002CB1C886|nr:hypothetical protein [Gemmatimonadaceae bacterium]